MPMTASIIHALLPYKEHYTPQNSGAVARVCHDMITSSAFSDHIHVFGRALDHSPISRPYNGLKPSMKAFFGNNIGLARAYLNHLKSLPEQPDLIEVHGRCQVAFTIAQRRPDLKVVLVLHNDPRDMKGGKTISERKALARHLAGVFAVSNYLIRCFEDGLNDQDLESLPRFITRQGIDLLPDIKNVIAKKEKKIVLSGRMVPEKGMLEAAQALAEILPNHPDWSARIIGARHFAVSEASAYEKKIAATLAPLIQNNQVQMLGFVPLETVRLEQAAAAISIVPSLWQEPAGRVVLESLSAGCALITTNRGGIPEYAGGRSLILDEVTPQKIAETLEHLISDSKARQTLQQKVIKNYPHTRRASGKVLDQARRALISKTVIS